MVKSPFPSPFLLTCFFFFCFIVVLFASVLPVQSSREADEFGWRGGFAGLSEPAQLQEAEEEEDNVVQRQTTSRKICDLSVGKWVYDSSYPLYNQNCPYASAQVSCQQNGRPDSGYERWRWKPHGCSMRRFNALDFLGKMRQKRVMLVGDSIMRNQWESLVCLVQGVIPPDSKKVTYHGPTMAFHALDFEASIEFFWAPFLVELKVGSKSKRILHLDSIEENAKFWRGVDVLVFDFCSLVDPLWKMEWDYFMEGNRLFTNLNPMVAYEKALMTWANWVDFNLNPRKTRVIFRSVSPRHNRESGWQCYNQREPLGYTRSMHHVPWQLVVLQGILKKTSFPVYLQDITGMSVLRRDAHPSVYARAMGEQHGQIQGDHGSDCSHWCLPGVPDVWNEMLYAYL